MTLTKAQKDLLQSLSNGREVTHKSGHYTVVGGDEPTKIWPSTFYGLYDEGLVIKSDNGNYTVSELGIKEIRG